MIAKCLTPVNAWYCGFAISQDGVYSPRLVFSFKEAKKYYHEKYGSLGLKLLQRNEVSIPCGKCFACRFRKRKEMTTRLSNELSMYGDDCCFITLTYNDDHLPTTCIRPVKDADKMIERGVGALPVETLLPSDVQKFIKRLRRHLEYLPKKASKRIGRDYVTTPIRYFAVGEYGGKTGRPHYHLLIFGWKPSDLDAFSIRKGNVVYRSKQVEKLWTFGFSTVQPCGYGVSRYCARYVTKKCLGNSVKNGEPFKESYFPEFVLQSVKNGGIGASWFDRHFEEILSRGYVSYRQGNNFIKASIPTYYLRRLRKNNLALWLHLREEKLMFIKSRDKQVPCLAESISYYDTKLYEAQQEVESGLF